MYKKRDGKLCNRSAIQGYSYCKQHTNMLLKKMNMPPLPSNVSKKKIAKSPRFPTNNICKMCNKVCGSNHINPMMNPMMYQQMNPMVKNVPNRNDILKLIIKYSPQSNQQVLNEYTLEQLLTIVNTIKQINPEIEQELSRVL